MGNFLTAQICENGHIITSDIEKFSYSFCPQCGSKAFDECPSCGKPIHGSYYEYDILFVPEPLDQKPFYWIIADGMQEAIISKELFDAAQERLKKIYKPVGKRPSSTYKHWLSGLLKCPVCGRTLTATTMKRANGEKYAYFSCYGYGKGKCDKPHGVSSLVIEKEVLKALEEALGSNSIVYEMREIRPQELSNERTLISERLASLKGKEDRIRASYREGIDTLEEYKENKALIAKERDSLERQLAELEENTPDKIPDDPTPKMLDRVSSVHDILVSDSYSLVQKNEALKQIIDKIVYDRESDSLKIHFFLYHS